MILLRNFYVGISSWNRYVLDTLAGGNFLGTPALEACTLIENLVGVPPIHVVKTEVTLEEVLEKLSSLEKSLPNILDNASWVNELIENIGKRITVLEASTTHDSQNLRIGKLPQDVFKIGKTFSSTKSDLQVESSSGTSKVPSMVSGDLEETVDLNTSFENT
jgi:DNA-directed RNA polymerase subunit H (RpoH/RPB5)